MAKLSKLSPAETAKTTTRAKARQKSNRTGPKKRAARKSASPCTTALARPDTKLASLITLLSKEEGATIGDLTKATGWQAHSVRGAISGTLKKKLGLTVTSEMVEGRGRVYRITNND